MYIYIYIYTLVCFILRTRVFRRRPIIVYRLFCGFLCGSIPYAVAFSLDVVDRLYWPFSLERYRVTFHRDPRSSFGRLQTIRDAHRGDSGSCRHPIGILMQLRMRSADSSHLRGGQHGRSALFVGLLVLQVFVVDCWVFVILRVAVPS